MIKLDYSDIKQIIKNDEDCRIFVCSGRGENKINDILAETVAGKKTENATRALVHFNCGADIKIDELSELIKRLQSILQKDANIIFGVDISEKLYNDELQATILITGFLEENEKNPYETNDMFTVISTKGVKLSEEELAALNAKIVLKTGK